MVWRCVGVVLIAYWALSPSTSQAQHAQTPNASAPAAVPALSQPGGSNPRIARDLSIAGSLAATGLIVGSFFTDRTSVDIAIAAGVVVLPSAGLFYARSWKVPAVTMTMRALGIGFIVAAAITGEDACLLYCDSDVPMPEGYLLVIGGSLIDIINAPQQARTRRRRLSIVPSPIVGPSRTPGPGVRLSWVF